MQVVYLEGYLRFVRSRFDITLDVEQSESGERESRGTKKEAEKSGRLRLGSVRCGECFPEAHETLQTFLSTPWTVLLRIKLELHVVTERVRKNHPTGQSCLKLKERKRC